MLKMALQKFPCIFTRSILFTFTKKSLQRVQTAVDIVCIPCNMRRLWRQIKKSEKHYSRSKIFAIMRMGVNGIFVICNYFSLKKEKILLTKKKKSSEFFFVDLQFFVIGSLTIESVHWEKENCFIFTVMVIDFDAKKRNGIEMNEEACAWIAMNVFFSKYIFLDVTMDGFERIDLIEFITWNRSPPHKINHAFTTLVQSIGIHLYTFATKLVNI